MLLRKIRHQVARIVSRINKKYYRLFGIKIGKGGRISLGAHLDSRRGGIVIGDYVEIAHGSYILSHTGFRSDKETEDTILEDNVRVFVNSVIFPGVTIGKNSIISAGSVVMKDIPPNVIVMGNPARIVQHLESND
jgi:acetyltransferase-like isoleucine patch superfamily enzyme